MFTIYSAFTRANQKVIVINPGHSIGYDSGAVSSVKSEAQVNQEVAGKVVRMLNARGYKVYITHTTDTELASQRLLDQEAGSSLKRVGAAVNSVSPDLAIAIHHNSGGTSSSGTELYWSSYRSFDSDGVYVQPNMWSDGSGAYRDSTPCLAAQQSEQFAQILKSSLEGMPNLKFRYIVERDDYLPAHATSPCVLYEGGYLSNPSEAAYLASDAYQNEAATRICNAIDTFFGGSGVGQADNELPTINSVSASATETGNTEFSIECNVTDNVGISAVRFATWTEFNGQDDIVWQDGTNQGNNNWSATINIADHNFESGTYITHIYAYDHSGNYIGIAAPNVTVTSMLSTTPGLAVQKLNSSIAVAYANNLGGDAYKFAVWSEEDGQDDLIWADGEAQANGVSYKHVINRADHNNVGGKYFVHCYTDQMQFVGANEVDFGLVTANNLTATTNGNNLHIELSDISAPDGIKAVNFAVWTEENGQDDLIWYKATNNNGTYTVDTNINRHNGSQFIVHAYLTDNYNVDRLIGATGCSIGTTNNADITSALGAQTSVSEVANNQFSVTVTNVPSNISIIVPVWSEINGQDDLVWYTAQPINDTHVATVNLSNHTGSGNYIIDIYASNGVELLGLAEHVISVTNNNTSTAVSVDTPIMGNSGTTAAQLVNLYNEHSPVSYPDYYIARGVSLGQFAQFYVDECQIEGVRADVAFAQAMLETGYLGFGGDVSISQFNFAGLGATGNGVTGENFAAKYGDDANGIRMGIRAQVQHLKAYASTDALNQQCVDSRFGYVTRGKALTISGLSGTWAADPNYAPKIVAIINYIK